METDELYQEAKNSNIPIIVLSIPSTGSMCIQTDSGHCYIGMDYEIFPNEANRRVRLAHELGHCKTGSFYNRHATKDIRQKHENHADKWAIKELIPLEEMDIAIGEGHTELWDLAEYFNVTEDFMRKAVCWYVHGNLNAELYF